MAINKYVVGDSQSSYSRWYDGRIKHHKLFARVEKYRNGWSGSPPQYKIIITKNSSDGPTVLCMDLTDWAEFSKLFDEYLLDSIGKALDDIGN